MIFTCASPVFTIGLRVWILPVTIFAVAVAAYELAQALGWKPPLPDLTVSSVLVAGLLGVFVWIFLSTRPLRQIDAPMEQLP